MLVSSTSMNAAIATTTAINHGLNRGCQTVGGGSGGTSVCAVGSGAFSGLTGVSAMGSKPVARRRRSRGRTLMYLPTGRIHPIGADILAQLGRAAQAVRGGAPLWRLGGGRKLRRP